MFNAPGTGRNGGFTEEERARHKMKLDETFRQLILNEDSPSRAQDGQPTFASLSTADDEESDESSDDAENYVDRLNDASADSDVPPEDFSIEDPASLESALHAWRKRVGGRRWEDVHNAHSTNIEGSPTVEESASLAQRMVDDLLDDSRLTSQEQEALLHFLALNSKFPELQVRPHVDALASRLSLSQAWFLLDEYRSRVVLRYHDSNYDEARALPPVSDMQRVELDAAKMRLEQFGYSYPDNAPPGMSLDSAKAQRFRIAHLSYLKMINEDQPTNDVDRSSLVSEAPAHIRNQLWFPEVWSKDVSEEKVEHEIMSGFKKKKCGFCAMGRQWTTDNLVYLNVSLLRRFVSHSGNILPRKFHGNCWTHQRKLARSIKRARNAALIPYHGFEMKPKNMFYAWPSQEKEADRVLQQQQKEQAEVKDRLYRELGYADVEDDLFGLAKLEEDDSESDSVAMLDSEEDSTDSEL